MSTTPVSQSVSRCSLLTIQKMLRSPLAFTLIKSHCQVNMNKKQPATYEKKTDVKNKGCSSCCKKRGGQAAAEKRKHLKGENQAER